MFHEDMKRTMYFFWHEDMEKAPIIVQKCLESWKYYNPTWNIVVMDMTNYSNYLDEVEDFSVAISDKNLLTSEQACLRRSFIHIENAEITKFTDVLRLFLLERNGGLWVDATCFCNCPLDDWLPNHISQGFFVFDNLTRLGKKSSNWFMYSEPNNYMIRMWKNAMMRTYKENQVQFRETYFIMHDLFDELCETNRIFAEIFENIPKTGQNDHNMYFDLQQKGNLFIKNNGFLEPLTSNIRDMIVNKEKYLFKLSHKCDYVLQPQSILAFLFSTIGG